MQDISNQKIKGLIFIGAIISCFVAFVNLYPLVYPDTGTYIDSGFRGVVPNDRSVFYGLFLRHISLSSSLWYVVFAQGFLISYMIFTTLGMFFTGPKKGYVFIASVTLLTLFTGFSYTVSILIPDIFSALSILCLVNLLINKTLGKWQIIFISVLFVFSICTQFSSIPVIMLLLILMAIYVLIKKPLGITLKKISLVSCLFLASLFIVPSVHYCFDRQFKISGASHVFMMNHFIETGILNDYLNNECGRHNYKICDYKDQLGWDFIWSDQSPLHQTGGILANKEEYGLIIKDILSTPKYVVLLGQKSVEYTFKQLFTFNVSMSAPQLSGSAPFGQISWRFKDSVHEYISSLQSQGKSDIEIVNAIQKIFILASIGFLLVITLTPALFKKLDIELRWAVVLVLIHNVLNSFFCANLSTVDPRFQNRIVWLLPLFAIVIVVKIIEQKKLTKVIADREKLF